MAENKESKTVRQEYTWTTPKTVNLVTVKKSPILDPDTGAISENNYSVSEYHETLDHEKLLESLEYNESVLVQVLRKKAEAQEAFNELDVKLSPRQVQLQKDLAAIKRSDAAGKAREEIAKASKEEGKALHSIELIKAMLQKRREQHPEA